MTIIESKSESGHDLHLAVEKNSRLDRWIESVSRWLNPILIKESRQSLKSNQFLVTFSLVLAAALFWSFFALAVTPNISESYNSIVLLTGYFWILAFPLMIIVPVWTYWSIVTEQDDNSLELITLSTMKPSQIVSGKFVTALLQIMIYLAVIAPCVCFTYFLRGIDLGHILYGLVFIFLASICLNAVAVFLATCAPNRALQILFLIGLVFICFVSYIYLCVGLSEIDGLIDNLMRAQVNEQNQIQLGLAAGCLAALTYSMVAYFAAVANLTFPANNRSTGIRVALLVQQAIFIGWCWAMAHSLDWSQDGPILMIVMVIVASIHWSIVGSMIVGESGEISQRVRRGLPKTMFAKITASWLMPGPLRGFFFVVSNIWGVGIIAAIFYSVNVGSVPYSMFRPGTADVETGLVMIFLNCGYATIYLGLTSLFAIWLRGRFGFSIPLLTLLWGLAVALFLNFVPIIVLASIGLLNEFELPILGLPSWGLIVAGVGGGRVDWNDMTVLLPFSLMLIAIVVANLVFARRELGLVRVAAPIRVQQEIEEAKKLAEPEPVDIFDDEA